MLNECVSIFKKFHVRLFTCSVQINFLTKNGSIFFLVYSGTLRPLKRKEKQSFFFL